MKKEKCTKYESLFTFGDEEQLKRHLKECQDCKEEHEEMNKISGLLQEAKPYYMQKRRNNFNSLKIASILCLGLLAGMFVDNITHYTSSCLVKSNANATTSTTSTTSTKTTNEYGIPLDNYGLIAVN